MLALASDGRGCSLGDLRSCFRYYTFYISTYVKRRARRAPKRSIGAVDALEHREGGGALRPVIDAENGEAGSCPGARILTGHLSSYLI